MARTASADKIGFTRLESDDAIGTGGNSGTDSGDGGKPLAIDDTGPTKRRGRPRNSDTGTGNRHDAGKSGNGKKASVSASIDALTQTLIVVHAGLATLTKTPELKLENDDAGNLATAVAGVMKEFDIVPDPKIQAVVGLVMCAGLIYGPKVALISMRKQDERAAKLNADTNGITGFDQFGAQTT